MKNRKSAHTMGKVRKVRHFSTWVAYLQTPVVCLNSLFIPHLSSFLLERVTLLVCLWPYTSPFFPMPSPSTPSIFFTMLTPCGTDVLLWSLLLFFMSSLISRVGKRELWDHLQQQQQHYYYYPTQPFFYKLSHHTAFLTRYGSPTLDWT